VYHLLAIKQTVRHELARADCYRRHDDCRGGARVTSGE
jgi:hypothetical protein